MTGAYVHVLWHTVAGSQQSEYAHALLLYTILMPPIHTRRACLTALEATKDVCFNFPTMEGVKDALNTFRHEVREYLTAL
jgi:hypothetical protein